MQRETARFYGIIIKTSIKTGRSIMGAPDEMRNLQ